MNTYFIYFKYGTTSGDWRKEDNIIIDLNNDIYCVEDLKNLEKIIRNKLSLPDKFKVTIANFKKLK